MFRNDKFISCGILVAIAFSSPGFAETVSTQSQLEHKDLTTVRSNSAKSKNNETLKPKQPSQKRTAWQVIWDTIWDRFSRKAEQATTRNGICILSPGWLEETNKIYSDRPWFVWRGEVDTIKVYDYFTDQELWRGDVMPEMFAYQYGGAPLEPGQKYIWVLERNQKTVIRRELQIISEVDRAQISHQKEAKVSSDPFGSDLLAEAEYFSAAGLWSDMLATLYRDESQNVESQISSLGLCSASSGDLKDI